MSDKLENKNILITGGTSGIGRETAITLAKNGANVMIAGRDQTKGAIVIDEILQLGKSAKFIQCDITKSDEIKNLFDEFFKHFGRIDCAFNNAGIEGEVAHFEESTEQNWDHVMNTNLKGIWYCMKQEISAMLKQNSGVIVNMASTSGLVGNGFGMSAYAASKFAIIGLTKSVALEYAKNNIRINAICPGFVETPMIDALCSKNAKLRRRFEACQPMGRMAKVEEIAKAVLYLCSDDSSFMTGASFVIDGGLTI